MQYYIKVEKDINIFVNDINPTAEKVILFIHGWPLNQSMFEYQYNELPKHGYRCIGVDIRGFGKSDKPYTGYSYDRISDDIRAIIETLNLHDITLAGHSVGGAISIRYMARHNEFGVNKLALFAAAGPSFVKLPNFPYGMTKEEIDVFIHNFYYDRPTALQSFTDILFNRYITSPFSHSVLNMGLEAAGYSTIQLLESLKNENLFNDVGKITVPTLILQGIHDKVCPLPLGETLNKSIKGSRLVLFENSGHGLFWEERDKFNKELMNFTEGKRTIIF